MDFRTPGNFTARPKTSCLVALPGVLVLSFARTLPRSFARTLPEGSGTGFGRVQLGGASPQIEVCHTELCQVFARELCQVFARRFSSLTPMRAWVLNYVRRELWSGQVILAPTLYFFKAARGSPPKACGFECMWNKTHRKLPLLCRFEMTQNHRQISKLNRVDCS